MYPGELYMLITKNTGQHKLVRDYRDTTAAKDFTTAGCSDDEALRDMG